MNDELIAIWQDLVAQANKNIASNDPYKGDEAIVAVDKTLNNISLALAGVMHSFDIMQTRLQILENKNGKSEKIFTAEELQ